MKKFLANTVKDIKAEMQNPGYLTTRSLSKQIEKIKKGIKAEKKTRSLYTKIVGQ